MTFRPKTNAKDIEIALRQSVTYDDERVRHTITFDQSTIQRAFQPSEICSRHYALEIDLVPGIVREVKVVVLLTTELL